MDMEFKMNKIMELISKKLRYKSSVPTDILVGFSAILAGYFYYYENKTIVHNVENTSNINYAIKIILGVIIIIVWLALSFQNGVKKRRSFLTCTLVLWIIPQIVKYLVDTFDTGIYSSPLQRSFVLLTKYLSGINYLSLKTLGDTIFENLGIPYYVSLNIIVILFEITFVAGFLASNYFRNNEKSSKTMEDNLEPTE
jgi:hypothetical protein